MPKRTVRSKKEKDLGLWLGDEYADKVAADSRPWYLRPNYRPEDIIIEADGVRGGTVAALVERLTAHEHLSKCSPGTFARVYFTHDSTADRVYAEAFLMTFKSFTTVDEFMDLLIARFRIQPPEGLTPAEHEEWAKLKQHIIQIR
jgi:son of sevenless-like protein